MAKDYQYSVHVGAPDSYDMLYDFDNNYLTDQNGKVLLHFACTGGSPASGWGMGQQATLLSEVNPLPHGIHVRWFSVAENQFWEGTYQFNYQFLDRLTRYTVNNILYRTQKGFTEYFNFVVYVVPGGMVNVWVTSTGEQYLIAQFQAKKVEESNWDDFSKKVLVGRDISRQDYIKQSLVHPSMSQTKQELEKGKPLNASFWQKLMKTYQWQLIINKDFILTDYLAWYVNGEKFFTYQNDNQLSQKRAVPYDFSFYFEDKNKELHRFDLTIDQQEIVQGFERIALTPPLDTPINLCIEITPDLKGLSAFLVKGNTKLELHKMKGQYPELYNY